MRRVLGLIGAVVLTGSVAAAGVAAEPVGQEDHAIANFELRVPSGPAVGMAQAEAWRISDRHLVPGTSTFKAYPGVFPTEARGLADATAFWFDPNYKGGANFVRVEGAVCSYVHRYDARCRDEQASLYIDVLDPRTTDETAISGVRDPSGPYGWDWTYFEVGQGAFDVQLSPVTRANVSFGATVTASAWLEDDYNGEHREFRPELAVDGDWALGWTSGESATPTEPQWIEIDLGRDYPLTGIRLIAGQWPPADTAHNVWGRPDGSTEADFALLHEFPLTYTVEGQWFAGDFDGTPLRYVKVETTENSSGASWIEVMLLVED